MSCREMITITVLHHKTIGRLDFMWSWRERRFEMYWLTDYRWWPNERRMSYHLAIPLIRISGWSIKFGRDHVAVGES